MKRGLGALFSLAYPLLILLLLRRFATALPEFAAVGLKLYPVAVSLVLFIVFYKSLSAPQTYVETLARLQNPDLDAKGVAYTRSVTKVWCVFLALNGLLALGLAFWASLEAWALYTGLIAYILMGLLFGGEWLYRKKVLRDQP